MNSANKKRRLRLPMGAVGVVLLLFPYSSPLTTLRNGVQAFTVSSLTKRQQHRNWKDARQPRNNGEQRFPFSACSTTRFSSSSSMISNNSNHTLASSSSLASSTDTTSALALQQQAQALRQEAAILQQSLLESRQQKAIQQARKIDGWIQELLIVSPSSSSSSSSSLLYDDNGIQLLQTTDAVLQQLQQKRYSPEQVDQIFERLLQVRPQTCRSNTTPLLDLLLEAVGQLDDLASDEMYQDRRRVNRTPNKRWPTRKSVEQRLQRKLFALDWGIELDREGKVVERNDQD